MASARKPTWTDVKARIAQLDRVGLVSLIQDLYAASKDNQMFLQARFGLGEDLLRAYKSTIDRWLWPDLSRRQSTSVATAKKAIADYRKAVGQPEGLAELMVFYCERAVGFANAVGLDDAPYYDALVRMFGQAVKVVGSLPADSRGGLKERLEAVRRQGHQPGYGVGEDMDVLQVGGGGAAR